MNALRILAVHGVGRHERDGRWQQDWSEAIAAGLSRVTPEPRFDVQFVHYDDVFAEEDITALGTLEAVAKLTGSGLWHGIGDWFRRTPRGRSRSVPELVRWTAGMVVQWAEDSGVRRRTRNRLAAACEEHDPDVVLAHSMGSLIAYDTFTHPSHRTAAADRTFVSLGSQISNPFVRSQFGGRIREIDCRHWYHLYNPRDDVLTTELRLASDRFEQIDTEFDAPGFGDHDATRYIAHEATSASVWSDLTSRARTRNRARAARRDVRHRGHHDRRALLVGINAYPEDADRLDGCVNDVFLMSEVLQESGFAAEDIRVVLDHRATADGIRSRLGWLLDGAEAGDERVFYFSGHGTQLTDYGADETVDRRDECLVPVDFDWTPETAITDDFFFDLYSQLPYDTQFLVMLDCCHSGGMTRAGGPRARGLDPPDDIRHRELRFEDGAWRPRSPRRDAPALGDEWTGHDGATHRFARANALRTIPNRRYNRVRERRDHHGPYLPVILQACQEQELAYEYRHGVTSYGAFTWTISELLRERGERFTWRSLVERATARIHDLEFEQTPALLAPAQVIDKAIPWRR